MLLNKRNITFEELRVDLDQSLLREMLKVTNGAKTVPQIFINDQYIGGFDDLTEFDLEGGLSENKLKCKIFMPTYMVQDHGRKL